MNIIATIFLTIIYIVYILLWFIGCGFVTFAFIEATVYKENKKNSAWDVLLFISINIVCFSGLIGHGLSIFNVIEKIKDLW